eukprot:6265596-Lingulodinium_polyedra.AAC.1
MARACTLADGEELEWLNATKTKTFEQLAGPQTDRFRRAEMIFAAVLEQVLAKPSEPIKYDVGTKRAELRLKGKMLNGRQM